MDLASGDPLNLSQSNNPMLISADNAAFCNLQKSSQQQASMLLNFNDDEKDYLSILNAQNNAST